jgi:hypothetical protein
MGSGGGQLKTRANLLFLSQEPSHVFLLFAMDRVKALTASHPARKDKHSFKAVLDNDMNAPASAGASSENGEVARRSIHIQPRRVTWM